MISSNPTHASLLQTICIQFEIAVITLGTSIISTSAARRRTVALNCSGPRRGVDLSLLEYALTGIQLAAFKFVSGLRDFECGRGSSVAVEKVARPG